MSIEKTLQDLKEEVDFFIEKEKLLNADEKAVEYEVLAKENGIEVSEDVSTVFQKLHEDTALVRDGLKEIHDTTTNWKKVLDRKGIQMYFRIAKTRFAMKREFNDKPLYDGYFCMKMVYDTFFFLPQFFFECIRGEIEAPYFNILSIFYEVDLYPKWVFAQKRAYKMKEYSMYNFLSYQAFNFPIIPDRHCFFLGRGVDLLDIPSEKAIYIQCHTVTEEEASELSPEELTKTRGWRKKNEVRMDSDWCGMYLKPLSKTRTRLTLVGSVDLKLGKLPKALVDIFMKIGGPIMFNKIAKFAKKVDKYEYGKRIKTNTAVYDWKNLILEKVEILGKRWRGRGSRGCYAS